MEEKTKKAFHQAVHVWILKPQVVHRRLFGAKLLKDVNEILNSCFVERILCTKIPRCFPLKETIHTVLDDTFTFNSDDAVYNVIMKDSEISVVVLNGGQHEVLSKDWLETELTKKLNHWYGQELMKPSGGISSLTQSLRLIDIEDYQTTYDRLKTDYGKELAKNWSERTNPEKFVYEDIAIASYLICLWKDEEKSKLRFVDVGCGNGLLVYLLIKEGYIGFGLDIRKRGIWDKYPPEIRDALKERTLEPSDANLFPDGHWLIGNHSDELTPWLPVLAAKSGPACRVFLLPCCPHDFHGRFVGGKGSHGVTRYRAYLNYINRVTEACGFVPEEDILRIPSTKRVCIVGRHLLNKVPLDNAPSNARYKLLEDIDEFIASRSISSAKTNSSLGSAEGGNDSNHHSTDIDHENFQDEIGSSDSKRPRLYDPKFCPRPAVEPVRNCTTVDREVRNQVCSLVFNRLLQMMPTQDSSSSSRRVVDTLDGRVWNRGGVLKLSEVSAMFDSSLLKQLKSEHGGLQTMLRNHHQVFEVYGGTVQLRCNLDNIGSTKDFMSDDVSCTVSSAISMYRPVRRKPDKRLWKTKPCWMFNNHPDGCAYTSDLCDFAHGDSELVTFSANDESVAPS